MRETLALFGKLRAPKITLYTKSREISSDQFLELFKEDCLKGAFEKATDRSIRAFTRFCLKMVPSSAILTIKEFEISISILILKSETFLLASFSTSYIFLIFFYFLLNCPRTHRLDS